VLGLFVSNNFGYRTGHHQITKGLICIVIKKAYERNIIQCREAAIVHDNQAKIVKY